MEGRQCEVEGIQRIAVLGPQTRPLRLFATALSKRSSIPRLIFRSSPMPRLPTAIKSPVRLTIRLGGQSSSWTG